MSGRGILPLLLGCLPLLAGCASGPEAEPPAAPAPSWQEAANASYAGVLRAPAWSGTSCSAATSPATS